MTRYFRYLRIAFSRTCGIACVMIGLIHAPGCESESRKEQHFVAAAEARKAFESRDNLAALIEQRWPLWAIRGFCIPERRKEPEIQNLVAADGDESVWRGTLFESASDFDEISWYATTEGGRALLYSLNARRGKDFWLIEFGDEKSVQQPPKLSPDPSDPRFVGHE